MIRYPEERAIPRRPINGPMARGWLPARNAPKIASTFFRPGTESLDGMSDLLMACSQVFYPENGAKGGAFYTANHGESMLRRKFLAEHLRRGLFHERTRACDYASVVRRQMFDTSVE